MTATVRDYVRLIAEKRDLDAASSKLGEQIEAMEADLIDQWVEAGVSSQTVDGYTVYMSTRKWARARDGDRQAVVAALEANGMADLITFNTRTLTAWWREREAAGEEVPASLAEVVDLAEEQGLNVRKKAR